MPLTALKKLLPAVFGLFEDLAPYIVYSARVTNSPKWTPLLNKKFVSCALDRLFEKACTILLITLRNVSSQSNQINIHTN
jgi:hypothetical protein